jgi:LPXTG-motif cell wall-anchored protein
MADASKFDWSGWVLHTLTAHDLSLAKTSLGSLAKKYGTTAQEIARKNGVVWSTSAINAWVLRVGGKRLPSGYYTFTVGNKIMLPSEPVIPGPSEVRVGIDAPQASAMTIGGVPWWGVLGLAVGGVWLYRRRKKKK